MNRADEWRAKGAYFSWSPRDEPATALEIFHVEVGDVAAPALVLVHGFPTSSIDWIGIAELLSERYRVCALDFPGYGFSDKPLDWGYSLRRDAELLEALAALEVPTTLIWGLCDKVAPPRVASYVWNHYMMLKPGRNCLYFLPDASLPTERPARRARRNHPARTRRAAQHAAGTDRPTPGLTPVNRSVANGATASG